MCPIGASDAHNVAGTRLHPLIETTDGVGDGDDDLALVGEGWAVPDVFEQPDTATAASNKHTSRPVTPATSGGKMPPAGNTTAR